ncbi:MAG: hypothetical protein KIT57_17680 [Blastocatellales bacterium]|nr:hypothetical protein [Blastocatellales bacterium]
MKYAFFAAVLFLLPSELMIAQKRAAEDAHNSDAFKSQIRYDRITDTTNVMCELIRWGEAPARVTVEAHAAYHGREPKEPGRFWLVFQSNRGGPTRRTPMLFKDCDSLLMAIDSERYDVRLEDYSSILFEIVPSVAESARAEISADLQRRLIDARRLEVHWGTAPVKFSDPALSALKAFISDHVTTFSR